MNQEITIVAMRRRHTRAVLAIEQSVNPKPWSSAVLQSELALVDTRRYFVAIRKGKVVGFAGLMLAVDDGHVTNIGVKPEAQRSHVATRLMIVLCRAAIELQVKALTLEVRLSNKPAQELYRRFGFAPVGVRKSYYQQPDEDALIMWAHEVGANEYRQLLDGLELRVGGPVRIVGSSLVISNVKGS